MRNVIFLSLCLIIASIGWATAEMRAERGQVTNLPLPRFVSMKTDEGNVRRGPSLTHQIDWVYRHENMPLMITAEYGHWRRVVDSEGQGGWMHYSLLSGKRMVQITAQKSRLQVQPAAGAAARAFAERGAILKLGKCLEAWCQLSSGRLKGWIEKKDLWGVFVEEVRD